MPEFSEVRLMAEYITDVNKTRHIVEVETLKSNKLKLIDEIDVIGKRLSATSRGKELKLHIGDSDVVITLGMSGGFKNFKVARDDSDKYWKHSHLRFKMSDGEWFNWVDVRRFGKSLGLDWGGKRGPDMFNDTEGFIRNILDNLNHKDFNKPTYEVLMNQYWFNGVGNYLRAEILGKWDCNPFQPIRNILTEDFLKHLIQQVRESYILGGGAKYNWKSTDVSSGLNWNTWIQYYGKGEHIVDKQKRTFWFDKKWLDKLESL